MSDSNSIFKWSKLLRKQDIWVNKQRIFQQDRSSDTIPQPQTCLILKEASYPIFCTHSLICYPCLCAYFLLFGFFFPISRYFGEKPSVCLKEHLLSTLSSLGQANLVCKRMLNAFAKSNDLQLNYTATLQCDLSAWVTWMRWNYSMSSPTAVLSDTPMQPEDFFKIAFRY